MLYHVYVEYHVLGRKEDCYDYDISSIEEIKTKYAYPFYRRKNFFVNGRVIKSDDVIIFKIVESKQRLSYYVEKKNASIPNNVIMFYTESDVLNSHISGLRDITFDVISSFEKVAA